ncbi:Protein phosphatase PrpC [Zhongshania aliphaticivorans]|uniref:Protein phosphatase PrpC n=2 Tax=Zhongshania aliphaticivorans TaxID=1470434 RepID=A0A5S9PLU5_9GAMM|nr:Stp1/IreP family PP2C-type Ser/Thr phosphatase [Zhongshania aliphaticivorans]CAA0105297.1 Protein phosphatase PrpC [Zhongshania aliphaticivorans]CAA0105579.1 Protein phosphatase PrpC [Zhongshania aliphaticivorans]
MEEKTIIRAFGVTDIGQVRSHNEDAIHLASEQGYVLVADGMGGHNAGEVASALAIEGFTQFLEEDSESDETVAELSEFSPQTLALRNAVYAANTVIYENAQQNSARKGMGTTLVSASFVGARLAVAHVGDSRLYRFREGFLDQLTTDHTLVQEMVDRKVYSEDEARNSRNKNVITRALGLADIVEVDLMEALLREGDLYVLCSDGLTGMVEDSDIADVLAANDMAPERAATQLLKMANNSGGNDNISIIVVRVDKVVAGQESTSEEELDWFD